MLNNDFIPASLDAIIAAFAASSSVGASGFAGLELRFPLGPKPGVCGRDEAGVSDEFGASEFVSFTATCEAFGLLVANGDDIGKLGSTFTGIMTTFLNELRKSFLSSCRLTLAMKKDSVEASSSESFFSQLLTCLSASPL